MLQVDGKNILCIRKGHGAVAVLSCDTRRGLTHSFPHVQGQAVLLLLLPLSLPAQCCFCWEPSKLCLEITVVLFQAFLQSSSCSCFCVKSAVLKCNAKHSKCYMCHTDLTTQCILPQYLTAQSHTGLFHEAPASLAVQHECCSENALGLDSEKTYPMFFCLMQRLEANDREKGQYFNVPKSKFHSCLFCHLYASRPII